MSTNTKAAEMLEQVNSAISAVLAGGQSYKIGSRSLTRADLAGTQRKRGGYGPFQPRRGTRPRP